MAAGGEGGGGGGRGRGRGRGERRRLREVRAEPLPVPRLCLPRTPRAPVPPRDPRPQLRTVSSRGRQRATGARYRRGRAGGAARAGPSARDRPGILPPSPGPLPAPLTASPFPGSAAATPPRPPRRGRARERRWAPCAAVSPGPRCCRRWALGWRRRPVPPSPRLPGWCSPSRRAVRAAAMRPSPPGKGRMGSGEVMAAPVAPGTRSRAGTAGGDTLGFSTGGRTAAPGQSSRWVGDKPLCHRPRCSSPGMFVLVIVCPCHRPNTSVPHCPHHSHPPCSHHPSLSPFPLLTPSLSPSRGPAKATTALAWPCPR